MARINLYGQVRHSLVLDGIPVSGFGEGDWFKVKINGNIGEISEGGDGPSMNISVKQGGSVTFSLMPTSPSIGSIYGLIDEQAKNPRLFTLAVYTGVDELITFSGCAFGDTSQFTTGGPKQTPREFVVNCLKIGLDKSAIETILGGAIGGLI